MIRDIDESSENVLDEWSRRVAEEGTARDDDVNGDAGGGSPFDGAEELAEAAHDPEPVAAGESATTVTRTRSLSAGRPVDGSIR